MYMHLFVKRIPIFSPAAYRAVCYRGLYFLDLDQEKRVCGARRRGGENMSLEIRMKK